MSDQLTLIFLPTSTITNVLAGATVLQIFHLLVLLNDYVIVLSENKRLIETNLSFLKTKENILCCLRILFHNINNFSKVL